jgi:SRSO17 transposase
MIARLNKDDAFLQRLDEYVGLFRDDFRRRDQARWAGVYLQGLLRAGPRKTIEGLAARVVLPPDLTVDDTAQALQQFVNQSPWDEQKLWRRYRTLAAHSLGDEDGAFVVEDLAFPKQGRHSVGVQRQFCTPPGRKINCQLGVSLHYVTPAGYCPLALRLYLPRSWLHSETRLDAAGVPDEFRRPASRGQVALELLDAVRGEGMAGRSVAAGAGYHASADFLHGLGQRGLLFLGEGDAAIPGVANLGQVRERVAQGCRRLRDELGLDHFEGRSWRGFHHHACLVMLAYGFALWERQPSFVV